MGIAEDLLTLAGRLANPASTEPQQASLRRAISTAYYSLFHLLVQDALQSCNGSPTARFGLERRFVHRTMKEVSDSVWRGKWRGWSNPPPVIPSELEAVAAAFVVLQEERQEADYDNSKTWTPMDVQTIITETQAAFTFWAKIRTDPAANEYLLSLLIGNKRE